MTQRHGKASATACEGEMKDRFAQHCILIRRQHELLVLHLNLRTDCIESLHDVAGAHRTQNRSQSVVDGKDVRGASPRRKRQHRFSGKRILRQQVEKDFQET